MGNSKFFKNKPISIPIQKYNIRKHFKAMIVKDFPGIGLKMFLKIQPTEISKFYEVLLTYESVEKRPQAYISISQLGIDDKKSIPHTYGIKKINGVEYIILCLYYGNEFKKTMNISDTIIPWICDWLYYFELWCITGTWCGGGKHPREKDIKENNKA